jgi:hypothetical protein
MNTTTAPVEDNAMNPRPPYQVGMERPADISVECNGDLVVVKPALDSLTRLYWWPTTGQWRRSVRTRSLETISQCG